MSEYMRERLERRPAHGKWQRIVNYGYFIKRQSYVCLIVLDDQ